jgi:phosphate acetyltransferase
MVEVIALHTPVSPNARQPTVLEGLIERCRRLPAIRVAVCHPCSDTALQGAVEAAQAGMIDPILVAPPRELATVAERLHLDLKPYRQIGAADENDAAAKSVALCRSGEASALMKGSLHTATMMHAVVQEGSGLRTGRRLSHVYVMDAPAYPRPLLITDAAINIAPTLADKVDIVQNAIDLALAIGIEHPHVAVLSAVETVNPQIVSTVDAAALCKMSERGQIHGGVLDGPLAFDTAISAEAAAVKQLQSVVAGRADILVVPDLESGNMLAKQLEYLGGARAAGVVVGARVPIVLTSRADPPISREVSCAIALMLAHAQRDAAPRPAAEP